MAGERDADVAMAAHAAIAPERMEGRRQWVHLLTPGIVRARDGRTFLLKDPGAVVDASRRWAGATDIAVDYEHQIDLAATNGKPAPAAGWIKALDVRETGIWGLVEWTEVAADMIRRKEYRYISPVLRTTPEREVTTILRAGLTNRPALDLVALASTQDASAAARAGTVADGDFTSAGGHGRVPPRMFAQLLETYFKFDAGGGAASDLGHAPRERSKTGRKPDHERPVSMSVPSTILAALDLPEDADEAAVLRAIDALRERAGEIAASPAALTALMAAMTEFNADRAAFKRQRVEDKIEGALRSGVIIPAMREWATALCTSDEAAFDGFVKSVGAPFATLMGPSPITPEMETRLAADSGRHPAPTGTGATIARQLGIDPKALG